MRIEIETDVTDLSRKVWYFHMDSLYQGFRLTRYTEQTRATKRHKWTGPFWDRGSASGSPLDDVRGERRSGRAVSGLPINLVGHG